MKVKAASLKKVGDEGATIAGGVLGAAASRGVAGLIPGGASTIVKGVIAGLATFGAASIQGTGTGAKLAKGFAIGIALEQGSEVAIELAQPVLAPMVAGDGALAKFGQDALGLASPYPYQMEYLPANNEGMGNPYMRGGYDENGNGRNVLMFG